jgi:hypothetical protein
VKTYGWVSQNKRFRVIDQVWQIALPGFLFGICLIQFRCDVVENLPPMIEDVF